MEWFVKFILFSGVIVLTLGACSYMNKQLQKEDDWWAEEFAEDVIEDNLNICIDLTPDSPEK